MIPRISVIIPLYNKAPHIRETLESVFAQSVQPCEIIVVDDGSTDGSGDLVAAMKDPRLTLVRQVNQGVSVARNVGIDRAQGEYVAFIDADDSWEPFHIEELARLINDHPAVGLYSTMPLIRMDGIFFKPASPFPADFSGVVKNFCGAYARGLSLVTSSTACVRRTALLAIGGFPLNVRHGEDVIAWIKLALGYGVAHSSRATAIYNRDATNRASNSSGESVPGSLLFLADLLRHGGLDEETSAGVALLFSNIAFYTCARNREVGEWGGLLNILRWTMKHHQWWLALKISLLVPVPPVLLGYAKNLRRKKK